MADLKMRRPGGYYMMRSLSLEKLPDFLSGEDVFRFLGAQDLSEIFVLAGTWPIGNTNQIR